MVTTPASVPNGTCADWVRAPTPSTAVEMVAGVASEVATTSALDPALNCRCVIKEWSSIPAQNGSPRLMDASCPAGPAMGMLEDGPSVSPVLASPHSPPGASVGPATGPTEDELSVQCFAPSVELQQTPLGRPSGDANEPPASAKSLQVYSRRWRHNKKNHIQNEPATPCKDLERIMKPVEQLLPRPVAKRRCCKKTSAVPRRSKRVAGVKPCSPGPVTTDAKRKVIRSLGFTDKDEAIDQKAQDDYCKLFEGRLTDTHLVALAAIFG